MYKSIFYKEWIKTRHIILLLYVVFGAFTAYTFMKTSQNIKIFGAVNFIETIIQKDLLLVNYLKYLPLLAGALLAIVQFVPEMQNKRLKLTLHLPLSESKILASMLIYGLFMILILFVLSFALTLITLSSTFPTEIITQNLSASLPWFLAGFAGYFISAWICFEPTWKQRIINTISGICAIYFFFIEAKSGGFTPFLPYLLGFIIISFVFSYYSVARFKDGTQ